MTPHVWEWFTRRQLVSAAVVALVIAPVVWLVLVLLTAGGA